MENNSYQNWFIGITIATIVLIGTYIPFHHTYKGAMYVVPDKTDVANLSLILNNTIKADSIKQKNKNKDSIIQVSKVLPVFNTDSAKILAINYLFKKFPPIDSADSLETCRYLLKFSTAQLSIIIKDYPVKTKSYFWLTGNWVYIEILFWSLLGLICNLLYSVSESVRNNNNNFKSDELPVHWAKFVYSPVITLVLFLAADLLRSSNELNISKYGYDTLVLAFILGFASRRAVDVLEKLKSIVLPGKEVERNEEDKAILEEAKNKKEKETNSGGLDSGKSNTDKHVETFKQ